MTPLVHELRSLLTAVAACATLTATAADVLGCRPLVDRGRIGAIGMCGSGSFVISAAKIDPRLKAVATVSMYDMGAANRHGLRKSVTPEQRKKVIAEAAARRDVEFA